MELSSTAVSWFPNHNATSTDLLDLRYNQVWFWYRCQFPKWHDWSINYTRKGLVKLALTRGLRAAAVAALTTLIYLTYKQRVSGMARLHEQLKLWRTILAGSAVSLLERLKEVIMNLM
jgi:hypothetical protein